MQEGQCARRVAATRPGLSRLLGDRTVMSVPGLVVMPELVVCQHFADKSGPNTPDQDDISI
jgi:hypothetical protein